MDIRSKEVIDYLNKRNQSQNQIHFIDDFVQGNHLVTRIGKKCHVTQEIYSIPILYVSFEIWRDGGLIQNVFSELSIDEREFLLSGYTPEEWNEMVSSVEE